MSSWGVGRDGMGISAVFRPDYVAFKVEAFSQDGDRMRGHVQAWTNLTSPQDAKDLAEMLWSWAKAKEEGQSGAV